MCLHMEASKNIAVFRMGRLGDFISAIPALGIIKRQYPKSSITYITSFDYSGVEHRKRVNMLLQKHRNGLSYIIKH